jgi:AraC-like DNA-binding protein
MIKENMHQSVEVIYKKVDECPVGNMQFAFFQLVYVISGTGFLTINGNRISYRSENLFLLTPNDFHNFDISTTTEFLLMRFNSRYVKEYQWKSIDHVECLLHHATHLYGCIMNCEADGILVKTIIESILHVINYSDLYNEDLLMPFINALIVIAARNISKVKPTNIKTNADKRILAIINYIQTNICFPQKLKASTLSEVFGISETYLGSYFKNQSGETIQHFISNYKIRLIEHRLKFSDMRINEITEEFGFSDESHLNKFFKKHRSLSLTGYRKAETTTKS